MKSVISLIKISTLETKFLHFAPNRPLSIGTVLSSLCAASIYHILAWLQQLFVTNITILLKNVLNKADSIKAHYIRRNHFILLNPYR